MGPDVIVGAVILWIIPIFVATSQGNAKHRAGFAYGLFLGWIGVLILAVLPSRAVDVELAGDESKTCPECAELVKAEARVCRFCGHRFDDVPALS